MDWKTLRLNGSGNIMSMEKDRQNTCVLFFFPDRMKNTIPPKYTTWIVI